MKLKPTIRYTNSFKSQLVLLLAGFILILSSCQKEMFNDKLKPQDDLSSVTKENENKKSVPFKATYLATIEEVSPTQARITGTGTGTHIGRFALSADVFFGDGTGLLSGTLTLTAANGDQIFASFTGPDVPPDENGIIYVINNNTITGGTGKFEGATGSFTGRATVSIYAPNHTATLEGTISY